MQLNVKYRKVEDLIPYVNNSRKHSDEQVAQISASIKEFGWTNPILIDGTNSIIAGHGRLMAARKLKMDEVPTIEISHLTDTQRKALVIADNKLALNADWDNTLLTIELDELLKNGLKNLTKSATESGLQFAEFAKNSAESFVQITGLVGIFTSSVDEASQITAKLANVFALVGTVEKTYQAITQGVIIVQEAQAASALLQASATTATATATTTATVAEQGYVATLYSKAVALAITNPLTAVATALVVASTVAYYA